MTHGAQYHLMNFSKVFGVFLLLFTATALLGQNATVMRMTGAKSAMVLLPDATDETPLKEGQQVPVGALITVGDGTKLFLRTFTGAITTAEPGTVFMIEEVKANDDGTETTRIELRGGDIVANLDPTKKGIHDYRVRTPKGVAAARGTTYTVSVAGLNVVVTVSGGEVSFSIPQLPNPVVITPGNASTGGAAVTLAAALSDPATAAVVNQAMQATAAAVATLISDPTSGVTSNTLTQVINTAAAAGNSRGDGGSLVAVVAAAATQANANVATQVVQAAVAATASSANASAVANTVVASVTRAAAAATNQSVAVVAAALSQAANTASGGTVNVNTTAITNAVNNSNTPQENSGTTPQQPTTTTPDVEVEVPVDNIVVSPTD